MELIFAFFALLQPGITETYTLDRANTQRGVLSGTSTIEVLEVEPDEVSMRNVVQLRTLLGRKSNDQVYRFDRYYFGQEFLNELRVKRYLQLIFAKAAFIEADRLCDRIRLYDFEEEPADLEGFTMEQKICPSQGGIRGVVWYMIEGVRSGQRFKLAFKRS